MTTAGLGVPVKLLHESLGHVITVELKTGQLYRGTLAEGALVSPVVFTPIRAVAGYLRVRAFSSPCSRGQPKHLIEGHHRNPARRACVPTRSSIHQGKHGQILHCPRYAAERAHVSLFYHVLVQTHCRAFLAMDRFKRMGPNAMRGRGIGTARGRATIMRGAL